MPSFTKYIDIAPNPGPHHGFQPPLSVTFDRIYEDSRKDRGEGAIKIGEIKDKELFSRHDRWSIYLSDATYKKEGEENYALPEIYGQFAEALQIIADYESTHSNLYLHKQSNLTIRQNPLQAGDNQQGKIWHPDGPTPDGHFPLNTHIYIVSDREGTLIQARPTFNALARLKSLDDQPAPNPELFIQAEPYSIYMMTNYCFHKSPTLREAGVRTFLRAAYRSPMADVVLALQPAERRKLGLG